MTSKFAHPPTEIDLVAYGQDAHALAARPFVMREAPIAEANTRSFVILTGKKSHFLLPKPRVKCPYHEWSKCESQAVGQYPSRGPLVAPSFAGDRAFFPNGRAHHCAAEVTYRTKAQQLLAPTATGSGERSLAEEVFCKIFDFESMLCCQTCVFFDVCTAAPRFKLPCMT